jgi:hypothetical protein
MGQQTAQNGNQQKQISGHENLNHRIPRSISQGGEAARQSSNLPGGRFSPLGR